MTITAKNYVAQCEKFLYDNSDKIAFPEDFFNTKKYFLGKLSDAVHFAIPDGGVVLDDDYKGIVGREVRLPFPLITTEYYIDQGELDKNETPSTKRVCLAQEVTTAYLKEHFPKSLLNNYDDEYIWITIFSSSYFDEVRMWGFDPIGFAFPSNWDGDHGFLYVEALKPEENNSRINGYPLIVSDELMKAVYENEGEEVAFDLIRKSSSETASILALCEALSCSNVTHKVIEEIDKNLNEKRIRKGKAPFYETRMLWVDAPGHIVNGQEHQGGTHRSPKQHLRRGHIRRLASGKNVWVNSAIVGSRNNGYLEKQYAIRRSA
jgi:hypothetical protein